jgi:hypothetical protein
MRIAHHAPAAHWFAVPESDPVDDAYEAQVQQSTERGERGYRQAQERLARAEKRLASLNAQAGVPGRKKLIKRLEGLIAERRAEVAEYERMMTAPVVPADKQLRLRTGLDDHLELGVRKRQPPKRVPAAPVTRSRAQSKERA